MDVSLPRKGIMRLLVLNSEPNSKGVDCHHKSALCLFVRYHNKLCSLITQARFQ